MSDNQKHEARAIALDVAAATSSSKDYYELRSRIEKLEQQARRAETADAATLDALQNSLEREKRMSETLDKFIEHYNKHTH